MIWRDPIRPAQIMTQVLNYKLAAISLSALEEAVRSAEPNAVIMPAWLVQKYIACDRGFRSSPFRLAHGRIHVIARRRVLQIAASEHLPLTPEPPAGQTLILLARPDNDLLASTPADRMLLKYWRMLFHARVDLDLQRHFGIGAGGESVEPGRVQERIERIGRSAFNEARFVLEKERYLQPWADDLEAYIEFVAVYLELSCFAPTLLPAYFPALSDHDPVLRAIGRDVDWAALMQQTRLAESADPAKETIPETAEEAADAPAPKDGPAAPGPALPAADRAAASGNIVRSAILHTQANRASPEARRDLESLVNRLQAALEFDADTARAWLEALAPVLARAATRWWNPEGRLLYDLQKVCVDHEQEVYSIGVVEWLLERCRRPLRRPQPGQRTVLACKHLTLALDHLAAVRLSAPQALRLAGLLRDALHRAEHRLRRHLRGPLVAALELGGLRPHNAPERVAEQKLIEELLDALERRGFLSFGSVRDAISRNQMKLHDLSHGDLRRTEGNGLRTEEAANGDSLTPRSSTLSPSRSGDQLLRIDRNLRDALDGVYHGGEIYLRFFQRLSAVLFGTSRGRVLTLVVLLPFGGAAIILIGLEHTLMLLLEKTTGIDIVVSSLPTQLILGAILLGVMRWPAFRHAAGRMMRGFFGALRRVFYDAPHWIATRPAVRAVVASRAMRALVLFGFKPLLGAWVIARLVPGHLKPGPRGLVLMGSFLVLNFLLNSPGGRTLEQAVLYYLRVAWQRVTGNIFGGLFRLIEWFFDRLIEDFERMLYAVDEWLRFRNGQRPWALVAKAAAGVVWFFIAYVARFCINLLIEPQLNPLKHFPVVTVSHKIVLPTWHLFVKALEQIGMKTVRAGTTATVIVTSIPGMFGFLAWELKENWKLYRANRPKSLGTVQVGHHGESLARLLRPGFHSGTVPRIFSRLRRAERRGEREPAHLQAEALEHVREAVEHLFNRELIALLNQHAAFAATPISLGAVRLGPTSITVELHCPAVAPEAARLCFEQRAGWILARFDGPGWTAQLPEPEAELLAVALLGLYKMSGVDLIGEQIESQLASAPVAYEVRRKELVVWTGEGFEKEIAYAWLPDTMRGVTHGLAMTPPMLDGSHVLLRQRNVEWAAWVRVWEPDPTGHRAGAARALLGAWCVLPSDLTRRRESALSPTAVVS